MAKLSFLGGGNMAEAMVDGCLRSGFLTKESVAICCKTTKTQQKWQEKGFKLVYTDWLVLQYDFPETVFVIAVKPQVFQAESFPMRPSTTFVISIMAGIDIPTIKKKLFHNDTNTSFKDAPAVVRLMPNLPSAVGAGASSLVGCEKTSKSQLEFAREFAESFGSCEIVSESSFNAAAVVGGCTPGWAFMFIESLADGGVAAGLNRSQSLRLAANAVMGAAKMVLESGDHPGELKDLVCSPGGTTIEGVRQLEKNGFRSSVTEAVVAATERANRM